MKVFFRNNGLSCVMFGLFFIFLIGQSISGHLYFNQEQAEHSQEVVTYLEYLASGHFLESVFENWESEFLQMGMFIILTVFLFQKGSAESKDPDEKHETDEDPCNAKIHKDTPWPVKKGGWILTLYNNSLGLAFMLIFLTSFVLHALYGVKEYNQAQTEHGLPTSISFFEYMATSQFWFESFQNWQSEFLSVGAMIVFSIYLRQFGSPESKPVATPHHEN